MREQAFHAPAMVEVAVGKEDGFRDEPLRTEEIQELGFSVVGRYARIHHRAGLGSVGPEDHAVGPQGVEWKDAGMEPRAVKLSLQIYELFPNFVE